MKRLLPAISIALMCLTACNRTDESPLSQRRANTDKAVFSAVLSEAVSDDSKTTWNGSQIAWAANDRLTIFAADNLNSEYSLKSGSGTATATFELADIPEGGATRDLPANYAVYPYDGGTAILDDDRISYTLPSRQNYVEGGFGPEAFPMVAVTASTTDRELRFKNLCGAVVFNVTGDVAIRRIELKGNNGEALSGTMLITAAHGTLPTSSMSAGAGGSVTLECGDGVQLSPSTPTQFYIAIPPTAFSQGFTVTLSDGNGQKMEKRLDKAITILRNDIQPMAPFAYEAQESVFEDANLKNEMMNTFDTDKDGIISPAEAQGVTEITINTDNIASLEGLEHFPDLTTLVCAGSSSQDGGLTTLDVSAFTKLETLDCSNNNLTEIIFDSRVRGAQHGSGGGPGPRSYRGSSLNLSGCTTLRRIDCSGNQLESLDVSGLSLLTYLDCGRNRLTSLDVSGLLLLSYLDCGENNLISLNLSGATALDSLYCVFNNLTSLDVSGNTALTWLYCGANSLTSLDVSQNTALIEFSCKGNNLSSLDLSNNTALIGFSCAGNNLTLLDVSQNTALIGIYCNANNLSSLNVSNNAALTELNCAYNNLTSSLDVSNNTALTWLNCTNNPSLSELWIKAGRQNMIDLRKDNHTIIKLKGGAVTYEAVDLGLPSGVKWATMNVGATSPEEYGDYFAWGEVEPKSDYTWGTYRYANGTYDSLNKYCDGSSYGYNGYTDALTTLEEADDAARHNWGADWRMPTLEEYRELRSQCASEWTQMNGVNGRRFTGPNGNSIFFPAAGNRGGEPLGLGSAGFYGFCWSSSLSTGGSPYFACYLAFNSDDIYLYGYYRYLGFPVRPVKGPNDNENIGYDKWL